MKWIVSFLCIFAILSSPSLYLFFGPFWEILSRKLDDDDVMLSWKLVRKSEIRFPMPFLRLYIDQIFSACLNPLCFQDDATFLLHTFSDFFDQERKMKRNWAYNLTHLTIFFYELYREMLLKRKVWLLTWSTLNNMTLSMINGHDTFQ